MVTKNTCSSCVHLATGGYCTWYGEDVTETAPVCKAYRARRKAEIVKNYPRGC